MYVAKHAHFRPQRTSLKYGLNRNYGFGVSLGDCADEPELRDLTDQPARLSLRRRPVEMVWPEVVVEGPVTQHVVSGGQDGSGDGADGLLGSPSIAQALKLGLQMSFLQKHQALCSGTESLGI